MYIVINLNILISLLHYVYTVYIYIYIYTVNVHWDNLLASETEGGGGTVSVLIFQCLKSLATLQLKGKAIPVTSRGGP
jgi:hypothetical protein